VIVKKKQQAAGHKNFSKQPKQKDPVQGK